MDTTRTRAVMLAPLIILVKPIRIGVLQIVKDDDNT
jgi:hypothetical protein